MRPLKGPVSRSGTLRFATKALSQLGLDPQTMPFRIGTLAGKRAVKALYLVPAPEATPDAFMFTKVANGYSLPLAGILQGMGVDYRISPYHFVLTTFMFADRLTGYELTITGGEAPRPKVPYTGKPRGREPKVSL